MQVVVLIKVLVLLITLVSAMAPNSIPELNFHTFKAQTFTSSRNTSGALVPVSRDQLWATKNGVISTVKQSNSNSFSVTMLTGQSAFFNKVSIGGTWKVASRGVILGVPKNSLPDLMGLDIPSDNNGSGTPSPLGLNGSEYRSHFLGRSDLRALTKRTKVLVTASRVPKSVY